MKETTAEYHYYCHYILSQLQGHWPPLKNVYLFWRNAMWAPPTLSERSVGWSRRALGGKALRFMKKLDCCLMKTVCFSTLMGAESAQLNRLTGSGQTLRCKPQKWEHFSCTKRSWSSAVLQANKMSFFSPFFYLSPNSLFKGSDDSCSRRDILDAIENQHFHWNHQEVHSTRRFSTAVQIPDTVQLV